MIVSSSEALVSTDRFTNKPDADYLFVIGNSDPDEPALTMGHEINKYTHRGAKVFLLAEAASRYIKEKGSAARGMSTHWENSAILRERMELLDADNALASGDGPVVTCAGMSATMDVVLSVMRQHMSSAELQTVVNIFLHEKIRDLETRQPFGGSRIATTGDTQLDLAIEIMQTRIEDPVPIGELGASLDVSTRALERKFQKYLGTTPNTYYRQLRLARANNFLLNTTMSVREVGLASGFAGGFSVLYKRFYGITPLEMRRRRSKQNRPSQK